MVVPSVIIPLAAAVKFAMFGTAAGCCCAVMTGWMFVCRVALLCQGYRCQGYGWLREEEEYGWLREWRLGHVPRHRRQ
jgi:hypothetical protein